MRKTAKEIIQLLNGEGIKVSKKELSYSSSSGYIEKYYILGSKEVNIVTSYLGTPTKSLSQGFITKGDKLGNYFYHNGKGFSVTEDYFTFLKEIKWQLKQ